LPHRLSRALADHGSISPTLLLADPEPQHSTVWVSFLEPVVEPFCFSLRQSIGLTVDHAVIDA
jgi:hypothetical protein